MDRRRLACLAALPLANATPALAQASTAMAVSVEVVPNCTVTAQPLAFGAMTAAEAPSRAATATIDVACGPQVPFTVAFDDGQNAGRGARRALDPVSGEYLAYEIYADPARTRRWGGFGAQSVFGTTGADGAARLVAYGAIGSASPPAPGRYGDVVTISTDF